MVSMEKYNYLGLKKGFWRNPLCRVASLILFCVIPSWTVAEDYDTDSGMQEPAVVTPWNADSNIGLGPLQMRSWAPLVHGRLNTVPELQRFPKAGHVFFSCVGTWVNYFCLEQNAYLIDAEVFSLIARLEYDITNRITIGVDIPVGFRGGGYLDRFIMDFHKTLGLGQHHRDEYPQNMLHIDFQFDDGTSYQLQREGNEFYAEDMTGFVQLLCTKGSDLFPAVSIGIAAKIPIKTSHTVFESIDYGIYCSLSKRIRNLYFYGTLSSIYIKTIPEEFAVLKKNRLNATVVCEFRFNKSSSFIAQYTMGGAVANTYYELSKKSHEITIGYKKRFGTWMLELGLLENTVFFDNSPDVGFHFGISFFPG